MDLKRLVSSINKTWDDSIIDRLIAYVRIPNKSPMFDPKWEANGHMDAAVQLMAEWCRAQPLPGMQRRGAPSSPGARRAAGGHPRRAPTACCSMATSTSSRSSPAGCRVWGPGSR